MLKQTKSSKIDVETLKKTILIFLQQEVPQSVRTDNVEEIFLSGFIFDHCGLANHLGNSKIENTAFDSFVWEFKSYYRRARTTYFQFYGLRFHFYGAKMRLRRILRPLRGLAPKNEKSERVKLKINSPRSLWELGNSRTCFRKFA